VISALLTKKDTKDKKEKVQTLFYCLDFHSHKLVAKQPFNDTFLNFCDVAV
jgi:hypothetical protein